MVIIVLCEIGAILLPFVIYGVAVELAALFRRPQ